MMFRKIRISLYVCLVVLIVTQFSYAEDAYMNLEPGRANRTEAEKILGSPVKEISDTLVEYGPQSDAKKIYMQYRADGSIVERIELLLSDPATRSDLARSMKLPDNASASDSSKSKLIEYFGRPHYVALTYSSFESSSKIRRVEYYSRELFEGTVEKLTKNPSESSGDYTASAMKPPTVTLPAGSATTKAGDSDPLGASEIPADQPSEQPGCCSTPKSSDNPVPASGPRSSQNLKISDLHVPATVSSASPEEFTLQAHDSKGNLKDDVLIQMDFNCGGRQISSTSRASSVEKKDAGNVVVHGTFIPQTMPKGSCTISIKLQDSAGNLSNPLQAQVEFN